MISTLKQLVGLGDEIRALPRSNINFNANLPVNVEVLSMLGHGRYRLRIGRKELTTRSQKPLQEGARYWGDFSQNNEGLLSLSHLYMQPQLFQSKELFLEGTFAQLFAFDPFTPNAIQERLLQEMGSEKISKAAFQTFATMLLALSQGVIHLPLHTDGAYYMMQLKPLEQGYRFYIAFEHLGPLQGEINAQALYLEVMYRKTHTIVEKALPKLGMITQLVWKKECTPLFDTQDMRFSIKG